MMDWRSGSGRSARYSGGSGADPAMLSTAILSGTGVRSAMGVARRLTNDNSMSRGQYGRASRRICRAVAAASRRVSANPRPYLTTAGPAGAGSGDVQNAQRFAAIGTSLRHSGHFFVVGSGGASPRLRRAMSAFTGVTTKK